MKKILFLVAIAALSLPFLSYAATYQYVDTTGELTAVEASTAEEAMLLATNQMPTSGVVLTSSFGVGGIGGDGDGMTMYQYVDVTGDVGSVEARSAAEALLLPANKAPTSGVYMAEEDPIPETIEVAL